MISAEIGFSAAHPLAAQNPSSAQNNTTVRVILILRRYAVAGFQFKPARIRASPLLTISAICYIRRGGTIGLFKPADNPRRRRADDRCAIAFHRARRGTRP